MSMIVARMQKMKAGNLTGIGNHNQRRTDNHTNQEIDTDKSHLNYDLLNRTDHYKTDIEQFINEKRVGTRAIRKDAVLVNEWLISSDRAFFDDLTLYETEQFFRATIAYFADKFGEDNIRYATVHLDETTPHMHMGIVPFDSENKLSAKRVFNREALREVQDELPQHLNALQFDIERGRQGSERKHLTVPEFKEMKYQQKEVARELELKKNELSAYVRKIPVPTDAIPFKKETQIVKKPSGETFLGIALTQKVTEETGNVLLSNKEFKEMKAIITHAKINEQKLLNLVRTDLYQENRNLEKEINTQIQRNNDNIDDFNQLLGKYKTVSSENERLKSHISDLKKEIQIIYKTIRNFLKAHTREISAFKSMFKTVTDTISLSSKEKQVDSQFKKEFDKEQTPKKTRDFSR